MRKDDVIIGIDNQIMEMSTEPFLGHVRQYFLRAGKRVDLKVKLK